MASEQKKPARAARILLAVLGTLLLLVLVLALLAAWLFGTESGTQTVLPRLLERAGVSVSGLHGPLTGPLRVQRIVIERTNDRIELEDVSLQWRPRTLLTQRTLHVESLRAKRMTVIGRVERIEEEPSAMPDSLTLPLNVRVDELLLDGGELRRGPATVASIGPLALGLRYADQKYALQLRRFGARPSLENGSAQARISGNLELSARAPFPLTGRFDLSSKARVEERALGAAGSLTLGGSLADLVAQLQLDVNDTPVNGELLLHPFAEQTLGRAALQARGLDLSAIDPALPGTALDLALQATAGETGTLRLANRKPGALPEQGMPLQLLEVAFREIEGGFSFERIHALLGSATKLPAGALDGSGRYANGALDLKLETGQLDLQRIDPRLLPTQLKGWLQANHAEGRQEFELALTEPLGRRQLKLEARGALADAALALHRVELQAGEGRLLASADLALEGKRAFRAESKLSRFSPQDLGSFANLPEMNLNGELSASGALEPQLRADLRFSITDSRLAGQPLQGQGQASVRGETLEVPRLMLASGANKLEADGKLTAEGNGTLRFSLQAPQLGQFGPDFGGALSAKGSARGTLTKPQVQADWRAEQARFPGGVRIETMQGQAELFIDRNAPLMLKSAEASVETTGLQVPDRQAANLSARLRFAPQPDAPLTLNVDAGGIQFGANRVEAVTVRTQGTTGSHVLELRASQREQTWAARAAGGLDARAKEPVWDGRLENFEARGRIAANVRRPARMLLSAPLVRMEDLQLDIDGGQLLLERLVRDENGMETRGRMTQLQLGPLLAPLPIAGRMQTDLVLSGEWDLRYRDQPDGFLRLQRESGDVTVLGAAPLSLGLQTLRANLRADGGNALLDFEAAGERLGRIAVNAGTRLGDGDNAFAPAPDAPLSGSSRIDVPSLAWAGALIDPVLRTDGRVQGEITLGGTVGDPSISGRVRGEALQVAHAEFGLDLRQGTLQSEFSGNRLLLQGLSFEGTQGRIQLSGPVDFGAEPVADLLLRAERFALLNRPDRKLVLSGQTRLEWRESRASAVGTFSVDSGFFDIGTADRPTLGDDVVIVGREEEQARATAASVDITVRLGDGVTVRGRGLDAIVGGQVRVLSDAGEPLQAVGTLRMQKGTFGAYGRELAIEQGAIRFNGALNNPTLDIVAMRRGQEVEAGVSVQGTVLAPRITLVSEPTVPDAEKLAWLVIGRSLANAGAEDVGSLQQAAASLLTQGAAAGVQSRIASAFGLDTFSLGSSDGTLQERIVTVGKQLSSRLYLGYQHGLESAAGVVQLRYLLSPRLSVEAETGARSAFSLFYNIVFD